ncbi:unnamed protein product, partial [Hymenolepis diminuta]
GAHLIVLSAFFPVFRKHLSGNDIVHVRLPRFPLDVVTAAVEYAYGGIDNISLETAVRLYLLAHNLKNKGLVDMCTKFLCDRIEKINVGEVWSAANATKNEVLIGVCAPLVAMKWEMFATSRLFHENTEIEGMMSLLCCPEMAQESDVSRVMALLEWRDASRDEKTHTARTNAFTDMVPLLGIQDTPKLITDLFVLGIPIPEEWRWCLAEGRQTAKENPIASSSMPLTSSGPKGQTFVSQERLAVFGRQNNAIHVWVYNTECSKVDVKLKIPEKGHTEIFVFQNKLVLIGGDPESKSVDLFDPSTGQLSSLPDMIQARHLPACVTTESEIFVFSCFSQNSAGVFSNEVYETASGRRVIVLVFLFVCYYATRWSQEREKVGAFF